MGIYDDTEVYAVPGKHSIIDTINPATGLTRFCGLSEAEVQARDPGAVRMTWADWTAEASKRQRTQITWSRTSKRKYWEMLEVLPPAAMVGGAFLVGEPTDHDVLTGRARFAAYRQRGSSPDFETFWVASRPLTHEELRVELGLSEPIEDWYRY